MMLSAMSRNILCASMTLTLSLTASADGPSVRIEPPQLGGSRILEKQTETSVIRDYLQSWKSFGGALDSNQADLLDADFTGTAREMLASTIQEQASNGIHTHYQDRSHDLQIVFYSPEGLSIQLIDTVVYDQQVFDHDKLLVTRQIRARYVVVLTPSETRWKVRIFQAGAA